MTPRPRNETFAIVLSPKDFFDVTPARLTGAGQPLQCMDFYTVSGAGPGCGFPAVRCRQPEKRYSMDDNKSKALAAALSQIEKQFGKGSIMKMDDAAIKDIEVVSTGSLGLDLALGVGGLPRGRVRSEEHTS